MNGDLLELVDDCAVFKGDIEFESHQKKIEKADELAALGFTDLACEIHKNLSPHVKLARIARYGYRRITREAIEKFLARRVALYNQEHETPKPTINKIKTPDGNWVALVNKFLCVRKQKEPALTSQWVIQNKYNDADEFRQREVFMQRLARNSTTNPHQIEVRTCHYLGGGPVGEFVWKETPVERYKGIPPQDVLETFKEHKARNLFDSFVIAEVNDVEDPLLLGRVDGVDDRFFVAQWGKDVSLDDVI